MKATRSAKTTLSTTSMAYLFILPLLLSSLLFTFGPMLVSFWWSLTDYNGIQAPHFVGLKNYLNLPQDEFFRSAVVNTLIFTLLSMLIGPALGLLTALLLNTKVKFQGFFRTAYFLPVMTSAIVVALVWRLLYNASGILNYLLSHLGFHTVAWLSDPKVVIFSVTIAAIWQGFGFETVVFLAALQGIPKELYEAARLDGANGWQQFWHVTVPGLRPVLFFVFCVGIIGAFQVFDIPYAIMGSTSNPSPAYTTLVYDIFARFTKLQLGPASAVSYVLFVALLIISLIQWRYESREEGA